MCLIVVKDSTKGVFTPENFETSFSRNSDGMGMMWAEHGRVHVVRILGTLKQQMKVFEAHMHRPQWVMHQRFATHGAKDIKNCHPYEVLSKDKGDPIDLYMAHNGVISSARTTEKGMSDTWNFVENHLKPILKANHELLWDDGVQMMISHYIGGSKLVFLDNSGQTLTFNKPAGQVINGCWLSNPSAITPVYRKFDHHQTYFGAKDYGESLYGGHYAGHWFNGVRYETWNAYMEAKEEHENKVRQERLNSQGSKVLNIIDVKSEKLPETKNTAIVPVKEDSVSKLANLTEEDKKDLIEDAKSGIIKRADLENEFTPEELADLEQEIAEQDEAEQLSAYIRESYDPDNVDRIQLQVLVNKVSKEFKYADLELLVDAEPEVATDMLEFLLEHYVDSETLLNNIAA